MSDQSSTPRPAGWAALSKNAKIAIYVVGGLIGLMILSGIGRSFSSPSAAPVVTQTVIVEATKSASPTPTRTSSATPSSTPTATVAAAPAPAAEPAPVDAFEMPYLIGANLQDAQDALQSYGSWTLSQEDASGAGRAQLLDRNWYVCSQYPEPGAVIPVTELVTLWSVKLDEYCP